MSKNKKFMKVSIIIPAYNVERHISRCLNSAITQTLDTSQYEIIVVNDCSKDKTLQKIRKVSVKFNNLFVINNTKTQGPGISRNKAIKISKGKYIFFLDGDDYIKQSTIKNLYLKAEKNNADVVGYNFTKILKKKKRIFKCRTDLDKLEIGKKRLLKNFLYNEMDGSVIYSFIKKKIILSNNINFKSGVHEDILFIFKVYFFSKKIVKYNKDLYFKVDRTGSILNSFTTSRILQLIKAYKDVYFFLKKKRKSLAKKYYSIYIRGLVGCIGTFLIQNFKYCLKNKKIRYKNYLIIFKNINKYLKKDILPDITFKDKITQVYLDEFRKRRNYKKSASNYEKLYKKMKLIKG